MGQTVESAKLDVEFLKYFLELSNILNTVGWSSRSELISKVRRAVFTLEDNGYDVAVRAILRGFDVNRSGWEFSGSIDE